MKTKAIISFACMFFLMTSCTSYFYQVYKAVPGENVKLNDGTLAYEDDNCKIFYSLWGESGNMSFRFYNKTDENIYINLGESFFIQNGIAYDYYQNRTFTNTTTAGTSTTSSGEASKAMSGINILNSLFQTNKISASNAVGVATTKGYSVSTSEDGIICIPATSSKIISEFTINETLYRDCNLLRYPTNKKQITTIKFSNEDSPLKFSNRLVYFTGLGANSIKLEHTFFINEITNYPEDEMTDYRKDEFCDEKSESSSRYFKEISPDKFYIKYSDLDKSFRH